MPKVKTVAPISLQTVQTLIREVESEGILKYSKIRRELERLEPGSDAWSDVLQDLYAAASSLEAKAQGAMDAIDDYTDSLPD